MTSLSRAFLSLTAALLLATGAIAPVLAAPIVLNGSTYSFRVSGTGFGGIALDNLVFDGLPEVRNIDGRALTMTENQQDLGNGLWKISLTLSSSVDMAPGDTVAFRFGHEDAIDLLQTVTLQSLRLKVTGFDAQGQPIATDDEVLPLLSPQFRSPWTGAVGDPPNASIALVGINWDVRSASYEMTVRSISEPAPLQLLGPALVALAWARRCRKPPGRCRA